MKYQRDVFIVGGGPAGLAAAIAARQRGLTVTVADASRPPIDKSCGEGLMPDALDAAARIGIRLPIGCAFSGIRFSDGTRSVAARFPGRPGAGIRRTVLHEALVEQAHAAGVDLRWGTPVSDFGELRARWIVGADGGNSRVRRWAGLDELRSDGVRYGFRLHYRVASWSEYMELHWSRGFQAYITPVAPDQICVVAISRDPHLRLGEALPQIPELLQRLRGAEEISTERGAVTATRKLRSVQNGRAALIGDASGSVDAITGEGLCLSFRQAGALAAAMVAGDLRQYEASHRRIAARPRLMGTAMLLMDRSHLIQSAAMRAFEVCPAAFQALLKLHVGNPREERCSEGFLQSHA